MSSSKSLPPLAPFIYRRSRFPGFTISKFHYSWPLPHRSLQLLCPTPFVYSKATVYPSISASQSYTKIHCCFHNTEHTGKKPWPSSASLDMASSLRWQRKNNFLRMHVELVKHILAHLYYIPCNFVWSGLGISLLWNIC